MSSELYHITLYTFFLFGMTAFALLINSILLRFVKTLGTKNQPGAVVRWSAETKPAIGGLAFFILFLISFWVYSIVFDANEVFDSWPILGLLISSTMGFVMGLTDDAYNTRPFLKLSVQILCGVILALTGSHIELFDQTIYNQILTVVWVVGIMNSINMLDNMDGIAAVVSGFIVLAAICANLLTGNWASFDFVLLLGLLGSIIGFLFFNWNPSSMYMGDTGSQFLGIILAYIGIHYCWNVGTAEGTNSIFLSIGALLSVFILPLTDTTTVTINRLRKGQSPFVGGKDHTTHNLSYLGFSDRQVTLIFCFVSAAGLAGYLLILNEWGMQNPIIAGVSAISFFAIVFSILFGITEYNKRKNVERIREQNKEHSKPQKKIKAFDEQSV